MTINEVVNNDKKFRYMLLSRMKEDCYYFFRCNKNSNVLWAKSVNDQINYMKAIYNSFSNRDKPEWITMEEIEELEKRMTN